jgi:4'-phosphopantetheinyl transferase EntD
MRRFESLPDLPAGLWALIVFSAKESTYKCHHPITRTFLDFHDVEIDLAPRTGTFTATIHKARAAGGGAVDPRIRSLHGRFAWNDAYVFTGVAVVASELPDLS